MKIGSIVAVKNNPFIISENIMPFISGEFNLTPPFMVVSELLYPNMPTTSTIPSQVNCIFFSEKESKFKTAWFGIDQLKFIQQIDDFFDYNDVKKVEKTLFEMKQNGQQFVLLSTDKELNKEKITQTKENDYLKKSTINNFYNNLPPVLTAIDFRRREDKKENLHKIGYKYEIKCKWFNHKDNKYSEEFIPLETLKPVEVKIDEPLVNFLHEKNMLFLGLNPIFERHKIKFKVDEKEYEYNPILKFERIRFNHYEYFIDFQNEYNKEAISIKFNELMSDNSNELDLKFEEHYKSFNKTYNKDWKRSDNNQLMLFNFLKFNPIFKEIYSVFRIINDHFAKTYYNDNKFNFMSLIGGFVEIEYLDEFDRKTNRYIHVASVELINSEPINSSVSNNIDVENNYIIKGNCLLRNGKERNFVTQRIRKIKILSFNGLDEFNGLSVQQWLNSTIEEIM